MLRQLSLAMSIVACAFAYISTAHAQQSACPIQEPDLTRVIQEAIGASEQRRHAALERLVTCDEKSAINPLILGMRHIVADIELLEAISVLTGQRIEAWDQAMLWQEANPQVASHPYYKQLKLRIFERIDPRFINFLGGQKSDPENMRIRLEEITWGGVVVDGIPSLDNPKMLAADQADYLDDNSLVFGVSINGDARAYPLRIMGWHEMFNDTIGGVPVALAYCTLCGAGILYETDVEGRDAPFVFGSSGFLYRSNKLMFDRETLSLWNQFTGEPVTGPLVDSKIKLKVRPVAITSWGKWREQNPETTVLSLETGHQRNYDEGVVYQAYFASPDLMFPALVDEDRLRAKEYVFGLRDVAQQKAWPLKSFETEPIINDEFAGQNVVLIGDPDRRTVRAYSRGELTFSGAADAPMADGKTWRVTEDALESEGVRLERIPGHIAYWFGWNSYYGINNVVYGERPKL